MAGQKIEIKSATKKSTNTSDLRPNSSIDPMPLKYTKDEDGNFICPHDGCTFKTHNQSTCHYHLKKHLEERNYTCKECSKSFLQKQTLDLHMRSKHADVVETNVKFTCPFDDCAFTSLTKGNLIIHCLRLHFQDEIKKMMLVDEDTKTIECCECDKEFKSSSSFYYHAKKCITLEDDNEEHQLLKSLL